MSYVPPVSLNTRVSRFCCVVGLAFCVFMHFQSVMGTHTPSRDYFSYERLSLRSPYVVFESKRDLKKKADPVRHSLQMDNWNRNSRVDAFVCGKSFSPVAKDQGFDEWVSAALAGGAASIVGIATTSIFLLPDSLPEFGVLWW